MSRTSASEKSCTLSSFNENELRFMNAQKIRKNVLPIIEEALNEGFDEQVIRITNTFIGNLKGKLLVRTIMILMKAWRNKANLSEQLQLAERLTNIEPANPEGYINAANVYSVRGQQSMVINVTKKGMKNVSKTHYQYYTLIQQHQVASARMKTHVDFFLHLPTEIIDQISSHLSQQRVEDLIECSHVSRFWRNQILSNSLLWRTYSIHDPIHANIPFLLNVTNYIEELEYSGYKKNAQAVLPRVNASSLLFSYIFEMENNLTLEFYFSNFMGVLCNHKFSKLRKLIIASDIGCSLLEFKAALFSVAETVTDLVLQCSGVVVQLWLILLRFKNLTSLSYDSNDPVDVHFPNFTIIQKSKLLKNVILRADEYSPLPNYSFEDFFIHAPNICNLTLYHCTSEIIPIILRYCFNLVTLKLNTYKEAYDENLGAQIPREGAIGLQYLSLCNISPIAHIRLLIEAYSDTLIGISLSVTLQDSNATMNTIDVLTRKDLPCIQELDLTGLEGKQLESLLQHCRSTRSLHINSPFPTELTIITNNAIQSIFSLHFLENLYINDCIFFLDDDDDDDDTANQVPENLKKRIKNVQICNYIIRHRS